MKIKSFLLSAIVLLKISTVHGQGTVDQQAAPPGLGEANLVIQSYSPIGQSFTPAMNSVEYVALEVGDGNRGNSLGATLYVNLCSGSISGPILESTTPVSLPDSSGGLTYFLFPTAVSLTPGTTYYFNVNVQSGDQWLVNGSVTGYTGGTEFLNGTAFPNNSLWFQEGPVPEPSVGWLALMGGGAFFAWRRWQMKRC
jgi:hypothetical protein